MQRPGLNLRERTFKNQQKVHFRINIQINEILQDEKADVRKSIQWLSSKSFEVK